MLFIPKELDDFETPLRPRLVAAVALKQRQARCQCGNPIWAVGTAMTGSPLCFTCITGEHDCSEDYEVSGLHTFVHDYHQN